VTTLRASGFAASLALATTCLATPSVCRAELIYDFSFTGSSTQPGTVTGEIDLPDTANNNPAGVMADKVIIDTSTSTFNFGKLPYNTSGDFITADTFIVANDVLTFFAYDVQNAGALPNYYRLDLNFKLINTLDNAQFGGPGSITNQLGVAGVTITAAATPASEPASLTLLAVGLAGLGMVLSARRLRRTPRLSVDED
jgi:hypothetical protein